MKKALIILFAASAVALAAWLLIPREAKVPASAPGSAPALRAVAAENFWGSLLAQIGGARVQVTTIVSDPNADPHEYESTTADARAYAQADYVVENGAGYDSWSDKLLSAGGSSGRKVLTVAELVGQKKGDNPHFWYDPAYVNAVVDRMQGDLTALDPAGADAYRRQGDALRAALAVYQGQISGIKTRFPGAKVAATEDIFVYLADAAGLDLVSPPAFMEAVAEGNDPPAASVATFQQQLRDGGVRALVYNRQTATPITESLKALAASQGIPVIGITETLQPPGATFQEWMGSEVRALLQALQSKTPAP